MKYVIIIIFLFSSLKVVSQTSLDSLLFEKINNYRITNGLNEIFWDSNVYNASNHHSKYLKILNADSLKTIISHSEKIDVNNFDELLSVYDRFDKYIGKKYKYISENIASTLKKENFPIDNLVDIIFNQWKMSIKHNEILLNPYMKFGACSIIISTKEFYSSSKEYKKKILMQKSFATLNVFY